MAYVPDYVRPIGPKSFVPISATPTSNNQKRRRVASFTTGSKSVPASAVKGERLSYAQHGSEDRIASRRSSNNPPFTPNNRFAKPSEDKICARLSIKDRLKILESEAAVKLEVRPNVHRSKRRSLSHGSSRSRFSNSEREMHSEETSSVSSISSVPTVGDLEKSHDNIPMPKPDIISSNQPRSGITTPDAANIDENASVSSSDQVEMMKESFQRLALALENSTDNAVAEVKLPHVSQQIDVAKKDARTSKNEFVDRKTEFDNTREGDISNYRNKDRDCVIEKDIVPRNIPVTPTLAMRKGSCDISSGSSTEVEELATKNSVTAECKSNSKSNGSVFKPVWRTPSAKLLQKPDVAVRPDAVEDEETDSETLEQNASFNADENTDATPTLDRKQDSNVNTREASVSEKEGSVPFEESRPGDANIITAATQSTSNTSAVELRSPRHEHSAQGIRRPGSRDKRNARVFIVPSSSDSDMDNANQQSRMERDFAKLGLPRGYISRTPSNRGADYGKQAAKTPEITVKQALPVKFVPDVLRSSPKESRSGEKKSLDPSIEIYPELSASSKSQRKESKPHDVELKKESQKSASRRRRSTRSGRSGSSRSKSTDSRKASKDVSRHRSNSMCDPKRMRNGQEAVAAAVIHGTGVAIPYIDDVSSPTDEVSANVGRSASRRGSKAPENNRGSIHRSNSADVLSSLGTAAPSTKLRRQRASSVDRSTSKAYNRRSYQIAMNLDGDPTRLQNLETSIYLYEANAAGNVEIQRDIKASVRSGVLHFKVATIDKGKRTSSQKSWRQVWAVLKDRKLCLSKECGKAKNHPQDSPLERQQSLPEEFQMLNVQSSLVGIAYNYLKRRNVFRLTTGNGSEYLFQAENRNDMLSWITAIQAHSCAWDNGVEGINEDLIIRKTNQMDSGPKSDKKSARKRSPKPSHKNNLQVKDVDGSRRFKWRGSVNKIVKKFGTGQPIAFNSTFGVHLEDCPPSLSNEFVPFIVELCCRIVEERGLEFTGIYRVPGNNASLTALQEDLNNHGVDSVRPEDERFRDLNVMSSLLKSFFRKLPEPLFTNELYHDFIKANRQANPQDRLNSLRKLVHMLPGPHYETLKFLILHLRLVADHCESNKMEVRNLAIVFGPTLVHYTAGDNTATMVTDMSDQCRIIESIIDHCDWFFSDNADATLELPNLPVQAEREQEVVPSIEFLLDNVGRKPGDAGTSESTKSKGSDDSENSFSRDLMEMIFGKKWKQNQAAQAQADTDDGGFGEYRSKKPDGGPPKPTQLDLSSTSTDSPHSSTPVQHSPMPNVPERLMDFYREQVERLSQTTIGQTLPAFSSADSSPRTTPRHSTVFNSPLVFPPHGESRSRVSSDSHDPRHKVAASYEVHPHLTRVPGFENHHPDAVPRHIHTQNSHHVGEDYNPNAYPHGYEGDIKTRAPLKAPVESRGETPKPKPRKLSSGSQVGGDRPQIEPLVISRVTPVDASQNRKNNHEPPNERLVGDLPAPEVSSLSRNSSRTGPRPVEKAKGHSKKSSITSLDALANQPLRKRRKNPGPSKENYAPAQPPTTTTSDRLFSRYDPKRRGMRFGGNESDGSAFGSAPSKKNQLTATERLFNGQQQQLRRRPSARDHRKQRVTRRHTLSGLQDLQERSPGLRRSSNLGRGPAGQNLSLHDLTSSGNGQQSAMARLNPKGANSGMTLNNWIVQERMRNKTCVKRGDTVSKNSLRRKDNGNQVLSYI